jgi:hypothetical protein
MELDIFELDRLALATTVCLLEHDFIVESKPKLCTEKAAEASWSVSARLCILMTINAIERRWP